MKLDLTPEQGFFHGTTRQFLDDKLPTSLVRELRNDPAGFGRDFWRQGADLGWTSLLVPEALPTGAVELGEESALGRHAQRGRRVVQRRDELGQALTLAGRTVREARRVIAGLRPAILDDFGLGPAQSDTFIDLPRAPI